MVKSLRIWLLGLVVMACAAAPVSAQSRATTADLSGTVVDQSEAVLPGATVTATNAATGLSRTVTTESDGRFTMPALPVGTYSVTAELSGFSPRVLEDVVLELGSSVDLLLTLTIAGAQEQVTVTGEAPVVDTQKTVVSTVVSQQQIESLPINGRDFISFSVITPGVSTDRTPQQGASATSGLTFSGQRARSNNITVDGLDNNDIVVGSVRATFSQEAVREFQVLTSSYSAEFGKASGGVVNIVTKSGTNNVDGTAFYYFRDESLNAKEHFEQFDPAGNEIDREKAPFSQNQFGGTIGGPLQRDRAFYFLSFERRDIQANNFVNIDDSTIVRHPLLGTPLGTPVDIFERAGFAIDTGDVPYDVESTQFLAKLDYQLNPENSLTIRFNAADDVNENIEPWGGLVARSRGAVLDSRDYMVAASHMSILSSSMVNELRFQIANRDQQVNSLDPRCEGECDGFDEGGPTVEVLGVGSAGRHRFTPQPRENLRVQLLDTLSYYVGDHQFKAGIDFSYVDHKNQALPLHFGGRYLFAAIPAIQLVPGTPAVALSAIQAMALGIPGAYVQGYGEPALGYGYSDISLFAQDDWRMSERFTMKYGVRYQRQFWPDVTYEVAGYPEAYDFPSDGDNIAPRVGFAWDPIGDRRTSIHGAYGLFYDNVITGVAGIADLIDGEDHVRTFATRQPDPRVIAAWNSPGRRLPIQAVGPFPSLEISIDPGFETPYAHHASVGVDRELPGNISMSANFVYARGYNQIGTIDYNPIVPALGSVPGLGFIRRPEDVNGVPGTSASILQYTTFGDTWYKGMTLALNKRFSDNYQFLASYTLSEAEDNSTDFQSAFIPQNNGMGRDPNDLEGLPIGFDPDDERGPSLQDQRHRFVFSGVYVAPADVHISSIITVASGRPYNVLAGADLNGDGDGGTIPPPDRARRNPADITTSVERNSETLPTQAVVDLRIAKRFPLGAGVSIDGIFEVFNLFDRTNYTDVNNIFGTGSYPDNPLPTFGQFTQAGPPRQIQLAARINF